MWTKSMATASLQSSWCVSRRYKKASEYLRQSGTDGKMMRLTGNLSLSTNGLMLGFDTRMTLYNSVSSTLRRNSNEKSMQKRNLRSVDEDKQAPPLSQRPGYRDAKEQLRNLKKEKREQVVPFIPVSERKRLHNQIDPSLQEYLEWPSIYWEEYFAEEHHEPSSSSSWSPSSSWWSSSSWSSRF